MIQKLTFFFKCTVCFPFLTTMLVTGNANEDTRRAMNKSFQTSGGTVLSTNWGEVGEKDYEKERQAPEGMQWKNWDGDKLDKEGNPIKEKGRD